jgi:hypothetical protein
MRQQHPVAAAGDLPQGRFHFRRRHMHSAAHCKEHLKEEIFFSCS